MNVVNQSQYAIITQNVLDEIEAEIIEIGNAFSGPIVIRDIPGKEGRNFIASCGVMFGLLNNRSNLRAEPKRLARNTHKNNGYLSSGGIGYVHRLVALTFELPNDDPEHKDQVNHKDEVKTHNYVIFNDDLTLNKEKSNLEWMTPRENTNHGTAMYRMSISLSNYYATHEHSSGMKGKHIVRSEEWHINKSKAKRRRDKVEKFVKSHNMHLKLLVEGCDNLGKSTIIKSLSEYLTSIGYSHRIFHCNDKTDWEQYFALLNSDENIIFDRSHIGEYTYGPIYRNCIAFEGKDYYNVPKDAFGLYVFTDNFYKIKDDGLSFDASEEAWRRDDKAFREAFDNSGIPHICIKGLTPTTNQHAINIVKYLLDIVE